MVGWSTGRQDCDVLRLRNSATATVYCVGHCLWIDVKNEVTLHENETETGWQSSSAINKQRGETRMGISSGHQDTNRKDLIQQVSTTAVNLSAGQAIIISSLQKNIPKVINCTCKQKKDRCSPFMLILSTLSQSVDITVYNTAIQ